MPRSYSAAKSPNLTTEITGSGTTNTLAKFTAGQIIGNSSISDDGAKVSTAEPIIALNNAGQLAVVVTAAATTTLTVASRQNQVFTGATTQTVVLPVVTTLLQPGFSFTFFNDSSGAITVNSSGSNLVQTMVAGSRATFTANKITADTTAAAWDVIYNSGSTGITNSAGANVIPKSNGTNLVASQISDTGTVITVGTAQGGFTTNTSTNVTLIGGVSNVSIDSGPNNTVIGDANGAGNGTTLTVDDNSNVVNIGGGAELTVGTVQTLNAGTGSIGVVSSPYASFVVGSAANHSTQIGSLATSNVAVNFPDAAGTVQLVGAANTGTILPVDMANGALASATGTVYSSPGSTVGITNTTEGNVSFPVTRAGTIRNLYVRTGGTAKVNTPATTIVVRKNGVDTALTIATLTQTINTTSSDTTHSFTVVAGDLITISFTTTGAAAVSTSIAGVSLELD